MAINREIGILCHDFYPISYTAFAFMFFTNAKVLSRLDLYLPTNSDGLKPVVIFVTGGAWIIG